jgi:hypothetical protein
MATFETLLHPSMDLTAMKQLGQVKTRRVQVNPESGTTFSLTGTATQDVFFSLPAGSKYTMINGANSYMCFDLTQSNSANTTLAFSNGDANSVFRSLETTNQGTTVEQIDRYNVMANVFSDLTSLGKSLTMDSILQGGCSAVKQGTLRSGTGASTAYYYRICVPIYSAFYGVLCSQYAPSTDGIRMRWTLESPNIALQASSVTAGDTNSYVIENMSMMMEYVDVEPAVWEELATASGRVFKTHGIGVANFNTQLVSGSTANSILIPCRKSAVKHIWNTVRLNSNFNTDTAIARNSTGSRVFPNLRQFYYTISGKQYPQIPIRTANSAGTKFSTGEAFAEFLKTLRNLHSNYTDVVFTEDEYSGNAGTLVSDSFVAGFSWETDADPMTISGIDTNSSNIYLQLDSATAGVPANSTLDSFVFYDAILTTSLDTGAISIIQ